MFVYTRQISFTIVLDLMKCFDNATYIGNKKKWKKHKDQFFRFDRRMLYAINYIFMDPRSGVSYKHIVVNYSNKVNFARVVFCPAVRKFIRRKPMIEFAIGIHVIRVRDVGKPVIKSTWITLFVLVRHVGRFVVNAGLLVYSGQSGIGFALCYF